MFSSNDETITIYPIPQLNVFNISKSSTFKYFLKHLKIVGILILFNALFKELVDSPQKRTEKTEEVSMIFL